jgi:transposase
MPASSISAFSKPSYQLYCGIDIAAKTFTASKCLPDEDPSKAINFKQTPEDFNQLRKYLLSSGLTPDQILVVMEATGTYWIELASFLANSGFAVSVISPSTMRDFAKSLLLKPKNDLLDAQTLARLAISHKPVRWTPPPAIYRELSQRLSQRADLMEVRQQLRNQLHALSVFEAVPSVVARLELLIETLSQQLKELDAEIEDTIKTEEKWAKSVVL